MNEEEKKELIEELNSIRLTPKGVILVGLGADITKSDLAKEIETKLVDYMNDTKLGIYSDGVSLKWFTVEEPQ